MDLRTVCKLIMGVLQTDVNDHSKARAIGMLIYEAPMRKSGYISQSLQDENGFRKSGYYTLEHYHSRQRSGQFLVNLYNEGNIDYGTLKEHVITFSGVHGVTPEENNRLSIIQNGKLKDATWQEQYKEAGIKLVRDRGPAPIYFYRVYVINNIEYATIEEAAAALGCDWQSIRKRCSSKAKVWADWKRK